MEGKSGPTIEIMEGNGGSGPISEIVDGRSLVSEIVDGILQPSIVIVDGILGTIKLIFGNLILGILITILGILRPNGVKSMHGPGI